MSTSKTKTRLTVTDCTDRREWNDFVESNDGPPFGLWGWREASRNYGHDTHWLAARDGGDIVGALPLVEIRSRLFGSKLVSPPYGERGSVILADDAPESTTTHLVRQAKRIADDAGVDFVSLRGTTVDHAQFEGFEHENRFVTFDVPVGVSHDEMWDGLKESRQRQIDQARENDLEYVVGESLDELREYYELYLQSVRGHGSPPHSFEFFERVWETFADHGTLHLGLVRHDGRAINGIVNLGCGSTVSQWGVITDYAYRDLQGGSFLLWKSMEHAHENGSQSYELGRTREGTGVYMFKKSFGGKKTQYDDFHYYPNGPVELPHPDKSAYKPIKEAWKRLPIPVTKLIGPTLRKDISL
ncbi:GNAT family N-acetyltransferase [Haloferax sp. KTX1]|uniref:GNAT family N-acetyltransferase n=1 Tax=Haloferax sp. KTX1 TaxID=2600597 RepID=UPI0011DC892A|nr:GNAT family N-acetyltransferase [Haloferax sp. KTX1]